MISSRPLPLAPAIALGLFLLVAAVPTALAAEEVEGGRIKGYVPPPTELKKLGEGHWTPYDPPPPPEDQRVHVVVRGDTLWDLALAYYEDHYLWPVIWDANRWVTYSHWIYPGDPLVIPPHPTVVPLEPPAPPVTPTPVATGPDEPAEPAEPVETAPAVPAGPVLRPVADVTELYCSSTVVPSYERPAMNILAFEEPAKGLVAEGDVVYLNAGLAQGVRPGAAYTILRRGADVAHPDSGKPYGVEVESLGRLEVLAVQDSTSTAEIVFSCRSAKKGDDLVAYEEIPVPMAEIVPMDRWGRPNEPLGTTGYVVHGPEGKINLGEGHVVAVDLGAPQGARPGDQLTFYRQRGGAVPRTILGTGVVLRTTSIASTVKIVKSVREINVGDRVEMP